MFFLGRNLQLKCRSEKNCQACKVESIPEVTSELFCIFLVFWSIFFNYHLTPISKSWIWVSVFDHQGSSLNCLVNPSISISSVAILNNIDDLAEPPLSSAHPDFKIGNYNYTGCLLIHYLLANGRGDEVLQRRKELNPSLLAKTCNDGWRSGVRRDHAT